MKNIIEKKESVFEICNHCGKNVAITSGLYVNRVPDFNDFFTRVDNGLKYPLGDFVCRICDAKNSDNQYNELYF